MVKKFHTFLNLSMIFCDKVNLMELLRKCSVILYIFSMFLCSSCKSTGDFSTGSLDALIRDSAFKALYRGRTGILYRVSLPSNFSGIEASVARMRSGTFWSRGLNFSNVNIPPGSIPMPFVKRVAIVYENLGNWSSSYYNVPGYTFVSPVIGFFAYDASDRNGTSTIGTRLSETKDPISVTFPSFSFKTGFDSAIKCVRFDVNGSMYFSELTLPNSCQTRDQGHFTIIAPNAMTPPMAVLKGKARKWKVWVIACVCGAVGLVLLGFVGTAIFKVVKRKKLVQMERQAVEGEALGSIWIAGSRLPSATAIRTRPTLENENIP